MNQGSNFRNHTQPLENTTTPRCLPLKAAVIKKNSLNGDEGNTRDLPGMSDKQLQ